MALECRTRTLDELCFTLVAEMTLKARGRFTWCFRSLKNFAPKNYPGKALLNRNGEAQHQEYSLARKWSSPSAFQPEVKLSSRYDKRAFSGQEFWLDKIQKQAVRSEGISCPQTAQQEHARILISTLLVSRKGGKPASKCVRVLVLFERYISEKVV